MDLNAADGFTLGFFKQVEVDFCRCNMLMREHFTYGVNISPACQLKHGVGVPETMESDMFCNSSFGDPPAQRSIEHIAVKSDENYAVTTLSA